MDENLRCRREAFRTLAHPPVVGEEDDLSPCCNLGENLQRRGASFVIELNEYVVDDKRHGLTRGTGRLHGGETQGKEELVDGPITHPVGGHTLPVWSHTDEDRTVVIDIRFKARRILYRNLRVVEGLADDRSMPEMNAIEHSQVEGRTGSRGAGQRRLIDHDHFFDVLRTRNFPVPARPFKRTHNFRRKRFIQNVFHKR